MKTLIGFYIRRTWRDCPPGKTMCMQAHVIFETREKAQAVLDKMRRDERFEYDVAEVRMRTEES